jgi:RNA polymerase sigma-70 factor (ECF subfamily)
MFEEVLDIGLQTTTTELPTIDLRQDAEITDERLVRAVLDGDQAAFEVIFDRYRRSVTRLVGKFFRERADIEECVQQAFTKTYFSLKNFRGGHGNSFPAWITRIAVNVCYDEFRRRQRTGELPFADAEADQASPFESVPDNGKPSAESKLASAELAERVLASLDPRDRIAMTLVYAEEYSLSDAANIIGISSSNLKSRLFRCRNHIKNRFGHLIT